MKKINTIGCCDSGLGGMFTVHELHKAYPNLNIIFIADQINLPYGDKTNHELCDMTSKMVDKFIEMNVHDIIVACNTICCAAVPSLKEKYSNVTFHSIIEPTYEQLKGFDFESINVLATKKTIDCHVYGNALKEMYPNAIIREIKAQKLVPIIEGGFDKELLIQAVDEYCKEDADAWILGCTHYPLIRPYINTKGRIFDSIVPVINLFKDVEITGEGKVIVYTSKDPEEMKQSIYNLFNCEYDVRYIDLKQS